VSPSEKENLSHKKAVVVFVTKTVVKVIHEHESSGNVRTVVIKEEYDNDRPTVQIINCFLCINQQISVANSNGVIIGAPVTVANINQINNIITNVNNINSRSSINNNAINNLALTNTNINTATINNPPPPPEYSPTAPVFVPQTTTSNTNQSTTTSSNSVTNHPPSAFSGSCRPPV